MKKKLPKRIFLVALIAMAVLEAAAGEYFLFFGVRADTVLIMLVIASFYFDAQWALLFSLALGATKDLFCLGRFGLNSLLLPALALLIIKFSRKIILDRRVIRIALVGVAALFYNLIAGSLLIFAGSQVSLGIFARNLILGPIYTASISPLLLKAFE